MASHAPSEAASQRSRLLADAGVVVPRFGLIGVTHQKANCAAVKGRCRLAIDGFGDHETAAIVRVSQAASSVLNVEAPGVGPQKCNPGRDRISFGNHLASPASRMVVSPGLSLMRFFEMPDR